MDLLQTRGNQIIDAQGQPVQLRGTCVGGWMNMENFINGYPGAEHSLRAVMAEVLGPNKAYFFFERLLDHFLSEDDIAFMRVCGATVVRLSLNYRHFERDEEPFHYLEPGLARLDRALEWCAAHGLYAILDLHAVQGWQNNGWHCDNASRHALFWSHRQFQDRFVALWEALAERYQGDPTVAGYNVMNEPQTSAPRGRFRFDNAPQWEVLNALYRRVVGAIRAIDAEHIIFLEGDNFSTHFAGLDAPFADNLVYSSHNYTAAGFGPGPYPGLIQGTAWDQARQRAVFQAHEGPQFAAQHDVPLWVGEFGSAYTGPVEEIPDRLRALDDQLAVFDAHGVHWTTWTYKDVGVMGWVALDPACEYLQRVAPILEAKRRLDVDFWTGWQPPTPARVIVQALARYAEDVIGDPGINPAANDTYLKQAALSGYVAGLMQPAYARLFKGLSETEIDRVLQSFAFKNCQPRKGLIEVVKNHLA